LLSLEEDQAFLLALTEDPIQQDTAGLQIELTPMYEREREIVPVLEDLAEALKTNRPPGAG